MGRASLRSRLYPACGWPEWRRRARRRLAWTALILTLASVPLLAFALVGVPHVLRNPLVRNVVAVGTRGAPPSPLGTDFATAVALPIGSALAPGHEVVLLLDGHGTFPRIWRDLRSARRSITVQMYYAGPGAVADSATKILAQRARAGVDVFFLYDAFGAQNFPRRNLEALLEAGVRTAEFRPLRWYALDRANHRSHVRGIVIDGAVAYTGGFGLDDKWLGSGRMVDEWRETNARFSGPAVAQLQAAFVAKWAEATGEVLTGIPFLPMPRAPVLDGVSAALVNSPPQVGSTVAERLLALTIAGARQRLYITNAYFVPGDDYVTLLSGAARRGVDVRILTNGSATDTRIVWLAGRARYEALLNAGARIFEYGPTTLHAKTFVVDGVWSGVTTMNFDNRSLSYNNEVALVSLDAGIGAKMDSIFLEDLLRSEEIRLDAFRERSPAQRGFEWVAGVLAPLL